MPWMLLMMSAVDPAWAGFAPRPESGGALEVRLPAAQEGGEGQTTRLPLVDTEVEAWVSGDLATVRLTQRFANPLTEAVEGAYLFPLPENAAVYKMTFTVGDEVIEGQIHEKAEAQQIYTEAKEAGKAAALLVQERPNLFVQRLANLMPGTAVTVELEYAHTIPREDGAYQFHFPMRVAERYIPPEREAKPGEPELLGLGEWTAPSAGEAPSQIPRGHMSLQVHLDGGAPLSWADTGDAPMAVEVQSERARTLTLREDAPVPNEDFILRYKMAAAAPVVAQTVYADGETRVVSLLVEPPAALNEATVTKREMVFLLDCSGSMSGAPMDSSKAFMRQALRALRPTDTFRVIRFSERASGLSSQALPATPENIQKGLDYVDGLEGTGGTQMIEGIRAALDPAPEVGRMRIVTFLTDGHIGNEADIIRLVEAKRRGARLFSFGVGRSVNRYLLGEVARAGQGVSRIVETEEQMPAAAAQLAERLASPIMTDLTMDWGDMPVSEPSPRVLPDLFAGEPVRLLSAVTAPGTWEVALHGRVAGKKAVIPMTVTVPADGAAEARALPVAWARGLIEDRMIDYMSATTDPDGRVRLQKEVTELGLQYGLVTQWTSFVAVSKKTVNPEAANTPAQHHASTTGGSAPEPAEWAALLALLSLATMVLYRRS